MAYRDHYDEKGFPIEQGRVREAPNGETYQWYEILDFDNGAPLRLENGDSIITHGASRANKVRVTGRHYIARHSGRVGVCKPGYTVYLDSPEQMRKM